MYLKRIAKLKNHGSLLNKFLKLHLLTIYYAIGQCFSWYIIVMIPVHLCQMVKQCRLTTRDSSKTHALIKQTQVKRINHNHIAMVRVKHVRVHRYLGRNLRDDLHYHWAGTLPLTVFNYD